MAIHALNALVGSFFAKGGLGYQSGTPWAKISVSSDGFVDDYAKAPERKKPRIDKVKTDAWPMASNMMQEIAKNQLVDELPRSESAPLWKTVLSSLSENE